MSNETKFEYRVNCSVNIVGGDFEGDWQPWEGEEGMTAEEIKSAVGLKTYGGGETGPVSQGLDEALELAGFDYWVEVRESGSEA